VHLARAHQPRCVLLRELESAGARREQTLDQSRHRREARRCAAGGALELPAITEQKPLLALDTHVAADGRRQEVAREAAHVVAAALQETELGGGAFIRRLVPRNDDAGARIATDLPPAAHDVTE
jgi:hypothetical protein